VTGESNLTVGDQNAYAKELCVKRSDFPKDFVFGVSTAAAQVYIYIYILVMIYDPRSSKIIQIHMFVNIYGYMLREWCRLKDQPKKEGGDQAFGISLLKNSKV
jgi:hypothetical protein